MTATAIAAWCLIALCPLSVHFSAYLWSLHKKSRILDTRKPKPLIRLSLVMALTGTLGAVGASILALSSVFFLINRPDLSGALLPLILAVFVLLDTLPIINAAYLRWLERLPAGDGSVYERNARAHDSIPPTETD